MEEKFWQSIFVYDQYDSTITVKIWQGRFDTITITLRLRPRSVAQIGISMNVALDRPKITVFMKSSYEMP